MKDEFAAETQEAVFVSEDKFADGAGHEQGEEFFQARLATVESAADVFDEDHVSPGVLA